MYLEKESFRKSSKLKWGPKDNHIHALTGLLPFQEKIPESFLSLPRPRIQWEGGISKSRRKPKTKPYRTLIWGFSASGTVRKLIYCCLSRLAYGSFLWQLKLTFTQSNFLFSRSLISLHPLPCNHSFELEHYIHFLGGWGTIVYHIANYNSQSIFYFVSFF